MGASQPFNGTSFKLWVFVSGAWKEVAGAKSNDFESSRTMINVSNKTDGQWSKYIAGRFDGKFTGSFLLNNNENLADATLLSAEDMWAYYLAGTEIIIQMGTRTSGDVYWQGTCLIADLKVSAPDDAESTYDATFQITGTIYSGS